MLMFPFGPRELLGVVVWRWDGEGPQGRGGDLCHCHVVLLSFCFPSLPNVQGLYFFLRFHTSPVLSHLFHAAGTHTHNHQAKYI